MPKLDDLFEKDEENNFTLSQSFGDLHATKKIEIVNFYPSENEKSNISRFAKEILDVMTLADLKKSLKLSFDNTKNFR